MSNVYRMDGLARTFLMRECAESRVCVRGLAQGGVREVPGRGHRPRGHARAPCVLVVDLTGI